MCGITGFWGAGAPEQRLTEIGERMADAIVLRGPDDSGVWTDAQTGLCLAFRRLAILDLSECGHQPMTSRDGRYVIVFNGEIYNFRELREELLQQGASFRGTSDTEVIVEGTRLWGFDRTVRRISGMFAIALWDAAERTLTLARDRVGKKPLYFGRANGTLLFGSELKALAMHPAFRRDVDRNALALYLRFGYVPTPLSIYEGISKVVPGTYITFRENGRAERVTYWNPIDVAVEGQRDPHELDDEEAVAELERLLTGAVGRRMVADVPLGAFLSGGLDSSTVVALMQAQTSSRVKTFTIGFDVPGYDEAASAREVAAHLGTDHTELYVTPAEALGVIPTLANVYDEPFADSSQIPTILVSRLARSEVTVALSGDGGDELFAGYTRYQWASSIWNKLGRVPSPVRTAASKAARSVSPAAWDRLYAFVQPALPSRLRVTAAGDKIHKLAAVAAGTPDELYLGLVSQWKQPLELVPGSTELSSRVGSPEIRAAAPDFTARMMLTDLMTYLPDDILTKVDRASMSVSLEARCPLLDTEVVEWAWRTPMRQKQRSGSAKWLLRQVLYRHVPAHLVDRPKMGFGIPIETWLRGPLREWAEELLDPASMRADGFLDPAPVQRVWKDHLSGTRNDQYRLWVILMFQAWRRCWLG